MSTLVDPTKTLMASLWGAMRRLHAPASVDEVRAGDAVAILRTLPSRSVQTCVTSPPYFGLRDYGVDGQIGLEESPGAFVQKLVEVFREVRRVLKDDGTLWLNLGDSYNGAAANRSGQHGYNDGRANRGKRLSSGGIEGLKPKDLIGIPWRVAFALQADGWFLRQDIIWHKPNPMPESVTDRCTKAHEYIFLLSKAERYYFDANTIREPVAAASLNRARYGWDCDRPSVKNKNGIHVDKMGSRFVNPEGRNKRSVWTVTTKPFKGAHFATFPPGLIEPCIFAGSKPGDVVLDPFVGSGTTAATAKVLGRHYIGIEINPAYIALARHRLLDIEPVRFP